MRRPLLTEGPLLRGIFSLATPMLLSALLQNAQSLIDLFWVGRLGPDAVASVAMGATVVWVLFPMLMGLATGTVALVARAVGRDDAEAAAAAAGQSLFLALVFGALSAGAGGCFAERLLDLLGAAPAVRVGGEVYLRVMLWGSFTVFLLFIGNAAMQGAGDAQTPMRLMLLANALNIVLDPLLIFGFGPIPRLEIAGAAWATLLAQAISALLGLFVLLRGHGTIHIRLVHWRPDANLAYRLLRIGIPGSGQMLSRSLMHAVLMRIVAGFGTAAVAAYGTGMRFHMIALMPAFALGGAAATLVGQNLGAGRPDRARCGAWLAAMVDIGFMTGSALILTIFAPKLIRVFNADAAVITIGASYLRIVSPFYLFAALGIVLGRALNGAGDSLRPMIFTIATLWGLQVPMAAGLARRPDFGLHGVWWAMAASTIVHGLLTAFWFEWGRWKELNV